MLEIDKYTIGVGDRFAHQGKAQLSALMAAKDLGVEIAPVWNKSHREHTTIGTEPGSVRTEADAAVAALGYTGNHYVDADHIGLANVDLFMEASSFFTLDVADFIGEEADAGAIDAFVAKYASYVGELSIPGIDESFKIDRDMLTAIGKKYVLAVQEAKTIYEKIEAAKGEGTFITEVSMDETDLPQTPVEMFFILAMVADAGIPAQTIAPRFSGRFNKGVDYVGDVAQFTTEFEQDLAVIAYAIEKFGMAKNLKLSVHSGSDKFSIYGPIGKAIRKAGAGLHLKTAGTTWLEELIGLALAGGEGLAIAKEVYRSAFGRYDELAGPYASVIDIDQSKLPSPDEVDGWDGETYADALRHDQSCEAYNLHFRQLLHVGYKVAAEMGDRYLGALKANEEIVAANVKENLLERHIKALFTE
jgi:hypothetical protein